MMGMNWENWRKCVVLLLAGGMLVNVGVFAEEAETPEENNGEAEAKKKEEKQQKQEQTEKQEEEDKQKKWKGNALKIAGNTADYFLYVDFEGMRESAIYNTLQGKVGSENKEAGGGLSISGAEKFNTACKRFIEITGLEKDDLSRMGVSGSVSELDFSGKNPFRLSNTVWTSALDMKQSLSFKELETLMQEYIAEGKVSEEQDAVDLELSQSKYKKHKIIKVTVTPSEKSAGPYEVAVTLSRTKRSLFMGTPDRVREVLKQNLAEELNTDFPERLKAVNTLKDGEAHVYNVFVIPSNLREKLEKISESISQENKKQPESTQEQFLGALGSLQTVTSSLKFADALTVNIESAFGKANDAARVNYLIENVVFGVLRATLVSASSGRAVPLLNTLEAQMPNETSTRLHVEITETDVEILRQIIQKQLNSFQEMNRKNKQ